MSDHSHAIKLLESRARIYEEIAQEYHGLMQTKSDEHAAVAKDYRRAADVLRGAEHG